MVVRLLADAPPVADAIAPAQAPGGDTASPSLVERGAVWEDGYAITS